MSLSYGFYNSINGDRKYNADQMSAIFDGLITDGIFATIGDAFVTLPGDGLKVNVGTGKAWFNHTWTVNDSLMVLPLAPLGVGVTSRIDAVVLEVGTAERTNSIKIVEGSTVKPPMTNDEFVHQYALAYVTVTGSTIDSSDIEVVVGQAPTPFVTGIIDTIDISNLMDQWRGDFANFLDSAEEDWDEWFKNFKSNLDGDVAIKLQMQVDERVKIADKATDEDIQNGTPNKWVDSQGLNNIDSIKVGDIIRSISDLEKETDGRFLLCDGRIFRPDDGKEVFNALSKVITNYDSEHGESTNSYTQTAMTSIVQNKSRTLIAFPAYYSNNINFAIVYSEEKRAGFSATQTYHPTPYDADTGLIIIGTKGSSWSDSKNLEVQTIVKASSGSSSLSATKDLSSVFTGLPDGMRCGSYDTILESNGYFLIPVIGYAASSRVSVVMISLKKETFPNMGSALQVSGVTANFRGINGSYTLKDRSYSCAISHDDYIYMYVFGNPATNTTEYDWALLFYKIHAQEQGVPIIDEMKEIKEISYKSKVNSDDNCYEAAIIGVTNEKVYALLHLTKLNASSKKSTIKLARMDLDCSNIEYGNEYSFNTTSDLDIANLEVLMGKNSVFIGVSAADQYVCYDLNSLDIRYEGFSSYLPVKSFTESEILKADLPKFTNLAHSRIWIKDNVQGKVPGPPVELCEGKFAFVYGGSSDGTTSSMYLFNVDENVCVPVYNKAASSRIVAPYFFVPFNEEEREYLLALTADSKIYSSIFNLNECVLPNLTTNSYLKYSDN